MGAFKHARIPNEEDIECSVELEWNQDPPKAPLPDRFGKAQIEQKSIVDEIILHMTRWKTRNPILWHENMNRWRCWTWPRNKMTDKRIDAIHDSCADGDEDGCHKPGSGRSTLSPDNHSYHR